MRIGTPYQLKKKITRGDNFFLTFQNFFVGRRKKPEKRNGEVKMGRSPLWSGAMEWTAKGRVNEKACPIAGQA